MNLKNLESWRYWMLNTNKKFAHSSQHNGKAGLWLAIFCLLLIANFQLFAQTLSLDSILIKVERNNPQLASYKSSIEAYIEKAKGARSLDAPSIRVGLDNTPYNFHSNSPIVKIMGEQMFMNPQKLDAKKSYLESLSAIESNEEGFTKNQLRAEAKKLYYERLVNERALKIVEENEKLMELMINLSTIKYKYGNTSLSSIYKAKASLEEIKISKLKMQNMIQMSTTGLNYLMWVKDNPAFAIDTNVNMKVYQNYINDVLNLSTCENRSDIKKMDNKINSMKLEQNMITTMSKPDYGLGFEHIQRFGMPNQFFLFGKITIPIAPWAAKGYKYTASSINMNIDAMQKEKENMINMASRMVNEALYHIKIENQILDNYQNKVIPNLKKSFDAAFTAYEQNTGELFMVLNAWEDMNMLQMQYLEHLEETLLLVVDYERAIEKK